MIKSQTVLFIFVIIAASVSYTIANNNLFLEGDAFFPTTLTSDDIDNLNSNPKQFRFRYSSYGGYTAAFCGYAGYGYAEVKGVNEEFAANLKRAYELVRKNEPRELADVELYDDHEDGGEGENDDEKLAPKTVQQESNGVRVMFYDKEFDFTKYKIGLRYNENWVADAMKFGHGQDHLRLCCIVDHPDAVMTSWRDSSSVAPLTATFPKVENGSLADSGSTATIGGKTNAIVFGSTPLSKYFSPDDKLSFMIVDENGITKMTYRDHKWIAEKK